MDSEIYHSGHDQCNLVLEFSLSCLGHVLPFKATFNVTDVPGIVSSEVRRQSAFHQWVQLCELKQKVFSDRIANADYFICLRM